MNKLFSVILLLIASNCFAQHKYVIKVKDGIQNSLDLSSRNYPNDSVAVTDGHLSLWDYYRTGNIVKVVTTLPGKNYDFYFTVNTADSNDVRFELSNDYTFTANVNWGDGTFNSYTSSDITLQHNYDSIGDYKITITFTGDHNLKNFTMDNTSTMNLTSIHNIDKLTELDGLHIYGSRMTNMDTLHYPSALRYIRLDHSALTSFHPTALPPILKSIDLNNANDLASFSMPVPTSTFLQLQLDHANLSVSEVNNILIFLDANTNWSGIEVYLESQQTPAPPSGAGLTAKNSLIAKGDSVTTD
jgi:hypothetical protein